MCMYSENVLFCEVGLPNLLLFHPWEGRGGLERSLGISLRAFQRPKSSPEESSVASVELWDRLSDVI